MINSIIKFSIKNKALIVLLTIALIIGGFYSMTKVPLDAVPDITNNQVLVITTAPNLGTEDIERFVTYQVELAVANLPDVTEIRSISRFGLSVVTIVFDDDVGTYLARQLVSEALSEVKEKIPDGFGEPFMAPISTGLGEIYQYTLEVKKGYDSIYDDMKLRTIQDWIVKRQMAMLPGVVEVNSFGGRTKQYEVAVDPDKLRSMGITMADIFVALEDNNENTGGAYIEKNHQANFIRGEGLIRSIADVNNTLVKIIDNKPVFVRDVADVRYGSFVRYGAFTKDGKGEAVGGIVMMLKGENSNEVIKNVKKRIKMIQKSLPEGIEIKPFLDRSKLIKSTTTTVAENLGLGALIVVLILVFFLGNLRSGLIVASTIPLAMLFAFIMMHLFGVWANLMSLGALDFGILIDGAVIIVESMIFYLFSKKYIGKKLNSKQRDKIAYKSAGKMMNSAFFGQLIILIVFVPVLALQGVEGKMFIPMAMTFGFAVLGVMLLSLTYIPMMSALFLQPHKTDKKSWGDKIMEKMQSIYLFVLNKALNSSRAVILTSLFLLLYGAFLFTKTGAEFIPQLDEGDFAFQAFLKPGTSLSEVTKTSTRLEQIVLNNFPDEVESIQSRIGVAELPMDPMPIDIADIFVILKPKKQWTKAKTKEELIDLVREKVSVLPGVNFEFTQPVEMRFNELLTGIREDVAIKLYGDDLDILADKAEEIAGLVAGIKGIAGIKAEATRGLPQITIKYNREKTGRYGLNIKKLNRLIETAFSGGVAGKIYEGEKMFDLVVRLDKSHRKNIENIKNLYVNLDDGNQIPLKEVADISYKPGPMQISRDNTNRRTYVGINVEGRDVKSLVKEIQNVLDKSLKLPSGYYIRYGGAFENLKRATERLSIVVPLALALIFVLVFFAVKSLKHTLMIYIAIPFAAVGGIFSLYIRDMPFSISAGIGFIVLFGVAVLNGLVLISSFNDMKKSGDFSIAELIKKGALRRMRPILLTASTDILGFLPMAVSTSAGAEVQRPLATVVIGGMISATILTLIVLPVLYKIVEQGKKRTIRTNTVSVFSFVIIIMTSLFWTSQIKAQNKVFTLDEAITRALEVYPSVKIAQLKIDKQNTLKSNVYDYGETDIFTGMEEIGNSNIGVFNIIGIEQNNIDIFGISNKKALSDTKIRLAISEKELTKKILIRNVGVAWYNALAAKQQWMMYQQLDSIFSGFVEAAKLKYEIQQTSKIEFLSASAKYKELVVKIKQAKSKYVSALQTLNQYLIFSGQFDIEEIPDMIRYTDTGLKELPGNNLILQLQERNTDVLQAEWQKTKANYLPKINIGYKLQSIDGNIGFHSWELGFSIPVSYNIYKGNCKAAKINFDISNKRYLQKKLELTAMYNEIKSKFKAVSEVLDYYEQEALPLADEQIKAANAGYRYGSIDYIQFIQNVESAMQTKLKYLEQKAEFYRLREEIMYMAEQ